MRLPFSSDRQGRPFQQAPDKEVESELAFHLEQRVRDYIARGMDPDAARAAALQRFGDISGVREECTTLLEADRRAESRRNWLADLGQDLRFGVRGALRNKTFSLLAIATIALGVGANAAVFGVVKSVLLDALPYANADQLMRVYSRRIDGASERGPLSPGTVSDTKERQRSFVSMAAYTGMAREAVLTTSDEPRVVKVEWVEPELFRTLGVSAVKGRLFADDDAESDTVRNIVVTHAAWQRLLAADPKVFEHSVRINGIPRTVVGILPRNFVGPVEDADFYFPLRLSIYLKDPVGARGSHWLGLTGRLKPGVTADAAKSDLVAIASGLAREYPRESGYLSMTAVALRDAMVGDTRTPLLMLMASAGLVLLITCANLAGAQLSRTISRRKEFSVRVALGAGRGRLIRQLLTESTVLSIVGGVVGVLLALAGLSVLRGLAAQALPSYASLELDPGALAFTSLLALATGVAFGLAPALSVSRTNPQDGLREETRGASESRRSRQLRGLLVAGQIALCVSLLAGAGLLARSLWAMSTSPLGFKQDNVLTLAVQLPPGKYRTVPPIETFFRQLEERVRATPGVTSVATVAELPTAIMSSNGINVVGAAPLPAGEQPFVLYTPISNDYFKTLGIPIRSGRAFGNEDRPDGPPVAIISEAMAKKFWPKGGALGARFRMGPNPNSTPFEVIGIAADVRNDPAKPVADPMVYGTVNQDIRTTLTLLVRTSGDPLTALAPVRRAISDIDPTVPVRDPMTLSTFLSGRMTGKRLPVVLMTAFGALALVLASVGVYAMFASMAASREREFGVRIALGSTPTAIARLVLQQGALWMALGLIGGGMGVVLMSGVLRKLLYGIEPFDPIALGLALLLLLACAALALLAPVRRATRVDPISVLR